MQYLAAIAALASVAVAAPGYGAEVPAPSETSVAVPYPTESTVAVTYPVESTVVVPSPTESMTVSTVYKTNVHTVTDCPSHECPTDAPVHYSTETVVDYTTTCPVSKPVGKPTEAPVHKPSSAPVEQPPVVTATAIPAPPAPPVTYPVPSASSATGVPPVPGNSMTYPVGMPSVVPMPTGTGVPSASVVYPTGPIATGAASKAGVEMGAAALVAAAAFFL